MPTICKNGARHWYEIRGKLVDNVLTIEAPSSFREPHGRTYKEGRASSRRGSRSQAVLRVIRTVRGQIAKLTPFMSRSAYG
jgi:hypothetical protein